MTQPWGVSAMEDTTEADKSRGSAMHRLSAHVKNTLVPESSAATKQRDERLEAEHTVPASERTAAFSPEHHVGGTNLTVAQGTQGVQGSEGAAGRKV